MIFPYFDGSPLSFFRAKRYNKGNVMVLDPFSSPMLILARICAVPKEEN